MRSTIRTTTVAGRTRRLAGALVAAGIGAGVLAGCGGTAGPETGATVEEIQEEEADAGLGPVPGDDVTTYAGQRVTVSAEVDDVLTPTAFTIAGTAGSGGAGELLIVQAPPGAAVEEESAVAVTGTVQQAFDLTAVEAEYGYDYDDAEFGAYDGRPYIVAENVDTTVSAPSGTTIEPVG